MAVYEVINEQVRSVARAVAGSWPGVIEEDDLEQEMWVKLFESSPENLDNIVGMDGGRRRNLLTKMAERLANDERSDHDVYSGNFYYSTDEVRASLEQGALEDIEAEFGEPGSFDPDRVPGSVESYDRVERRSDITVGMERLKKRNSAYWAAIENRYRHDLVPVTGGDRKNLTRAIDALTDQMNRSRNAKKEAWVNSGGPGSRKVRSNAASIAVTERQENQ